MPAFAHIASLHKALVKRRGLVLACAALLLGLLTLTLFGRDLDEDIAVMLPSQTGQVAADFELLRKAPFSRRLVITVRGPQVALASRKLAQALPTPLFSDVMWGPGGAGNARGAGGTFAGLLEMTPLLATARDLDVLAQKTSPEGVRAALERDLRQLLSPEALVLKTMVQRDPLELREVPLGKLKAASPGAGLRIQDGAFVSADGNHALILASTPVPMTDSRGARDVVAALEQAAAASLPEGTTATLVGGHRHTLENADAIKGDLSVVLPLSLLGLIAIYVFFVRRATALLTLLIPGAAFVVGAAAVSLFFGNASGIVLGFGGVLLGICVDFALHVYFALRTSRQPSGTVLSEVARPLCFGALTSCAAFGALLLSDIAGIRQLAVFSMAGIGAALTLSLLVLPLLGRPRGVLPSSSLLRRMAAPGPLGLRLVLWGLFAIICIVLGSQVHVSADLRQLAYTSESLRHDEQQVRELWGGVRDRAVIFARGKTLEQALQTNDAVVQRLETADALDDVVSLAPLLPSRQQQRSNAQGWAEFWTRNETRVRETVATQGQTLGFARSAFDPFWASLDLPGKIVTPESLRSLGAGLLVDMLLDEDEAGVSAMTLVPDTPAINALFGPDTEQRLGVRLVSGQRFRTDMGHAVRRDVLRFGGLALLAVSALVFVLFRSVRLWFAAMVPVFAGLLAVAGAVGLGGQMNLFHVVTAPLVIGLGADYGIFLACRAGGSARHGTEQAVLVSGLTTLVGLGALVLARHPAMHSIGLVVLAGIAAAMLAALTLTPRLAGGRR